MMSKRVSPKNNVEPQLGPAMSMANNSGVTGQAGRVHEPNPQLASFGRRAPGAKYLRGHTGTAPGSKYQ